MLYPAAGSRANLQITQERTANSLCKPLASETLMKNKLIILAVFMAHETLLYGNSALATQDHGGPEGIYVHQMSHIFFAFSLCVLIYWLRQRELVKKTGWRYIQYAAFFFILWNSDAFTVHLISEQMNWVQSERVSSWQFRITAVNHGPWIEYFYFFIKLDHLLCVPAIFFLYAGLKSLLKEIQQGDET
jgi:hypothetical protein